MTPDCLPPQPYIPPMKNVRIFLLGLLWACLGGLAAACVELVDDLTTFGGEPIVWGHVAKLAGAGMAPMVFGYWQKYKALLQPPPTDSRPRVFADSLPIAPEPTVFPIHPEEPKL